MTYPPSSSGYPPGQQTTQQFSAPTQQFGKAEQPQATPAQAAAGPSKLPLYLLVAVAVLGLAVYLFSFGPMFTISDTDFPQLGSASGTSLGLGLAVVASLLAGLLAGASLLPKQKAAVGVVAAVSVLGFLLVIAEIINKPEGVSIGWALYVVIVLTSPAGSGGDRCLAARRGHRLGARAAAEARAAAVRPVRRAEPVLRSAAAPARSSPASASGISVAIRRRLPGGWIVLRRLLRAASRAAHRRRRPASRPTASRRHPRPRRPARFRRSRSRRIRRISPATRRHSPGLACVTSRA